MKGNQDIRLLLKDDSLSQKVLTSKLMALYHKEITLLNEKFVLGRTVFHMLLIKKKITALNQLLQVREFLPFALTADRVGLGLMHYVVRAESVDYDLLRLLCEKLPELVNQRGNKKGYTPIHLAVIQENLQAIEIMIQYGVADVSIQTVDGKTAAQLAGDDKKMLEVLHFASSPACSSYTVEVPSLNLSELQRTFPSITSSSRSSRSTSSDLSLSSSGGKSYTDEKLPLLPITEQLIFLEQLAPKDPTGNYHQEVIALAERLTTTTRLDKTSEIASIQAIFQRSPKLLDELNSAMRQILQQEYKEHIDIMRSMDNAYRELLDRVLAKEVLAPPSKPDLSTVSKERQSFFLLLWDVIHSSSKTEFGLKQEIPSETLLMGINAGYSITETTIAIRHIISQLSPISRLVANYILFKMVIINESELSLATSNVDLHLRFVQKYNRRYTMPEGIAASAINQKLDELIDKAKCFSQRSSATNYALLMDLKEKVSPTTSYISFESLLDTALARQSDKRQEAVSVLVSCLRNVSMRFMQNLRHSEFYRGAWQGKDKERKAPTIVQQTHYFNRLSNFLVHKILSQPDEKSVINAIELILELVPELCPMTSCQFNDLNSVMIISSVLENTSISRLKFIPQLSKKHAKLYQELALLVNPKDNFKWMATLTESSPKTLPFLGMHLTHITSASDGCGELIAFAEILGKILHQFKLVQQEVFTLVIPEHPNVLNELMRYELCSEDALYYSSVRRKPRASDKLSLSVEPKEYREILTRINEEFLQNNLIPTLQYQGKEVAPIKALNTLLAWSETVLNAKSADVDKTQRAVSLSLLKNTLYRLKKVSNSHYDLSLNTLYINKRLGALTAPIESESTATTSMPRSRSSLLHLSSAMFNRKGRTRHVDTVVAASSASSFEL